MKREDGKHVGWIYEYECTDVNLKKWYGFNYVGQTRQKGGVMTRDFKHKNDSKTHFDRAYSKHPESFELRIIDEIVRDTEEELIDELNYLESYYIMAFYSFNDWGVRGFNHTMGGGVGTYSEDVRQRMSEAQKKLWQNPEHRQKMNEVASTPETWKKKSEALKKAFSNSSVRKKRSESLKKTLSNPDIQKKKSEATTKMWQNEEFKKKTSDAIKRAYSSPETRAMCSERTKKPCHVLDLETGFCFDFNSRIEASEFIGVSPKHLSKHTSKPYKKRWIYIP